MATPRTPSPKPPDPKADREKTIKDAHAKALKRAIDNFLKAANEWHAAPDGTIGKRQAAARAKACRKALDDTVGTFVRRERLDAHAHSYAMIERHVANLERHTEVSPAEASVLRRVVRQISSAVKESRADVERQRNAIDEQVANSS